ncbi:hypothetical protein OP862_02150 [Yersinia massiliensis]|uniref:Uncharacterized protein n=1 Tax=Yersinia aldovae TaxID=29483 RepID=A0ABM9SXR4_YERAL|nr:MULTISPECIES: hypothetical protein [Yersinia]MBX9474166.1 hypothetical protein [Yersinia enterocolitica]MDA5548573.1 hypothetical protein [Yersinia massiliensis]UZM79512.1 hypothetical protein OP862_02150 [Yersinia massiliensis]CNL62174.1 Uncharacterised protein [Yersinia aldovae]
MSDDNFLITETNKIIIAALSSGNFESLSKVAANELPIRSDGSRTGVSTVTYSEIYATIFNMMNKAKEAQDKKPDPAF